MSVSSPRKGLTPSLAVLTFAALSAAFNVHAAANDSAGESLPAAIQPVVVTQPKSANPELDQKLTTALNETAAFLIAQYKDPDFSPLKSQELQRRIDEIKVLVISGANPNNYVPDTLTMESGNLSPFGAAILIAARARRSDLVQTFIDNGADIRLRTNRGWGPMDYAIAALLYSQGNNSNAVPSRAEVDAAVKIVKILDTAGLRPADATMLTKGSTLRTKNYATIGSLFSNKPSMQSNGQVVRDIMHKEGLLSDADYNAEFKGDRKNAATLLNANGITDDMLKANGGSINDDVDDTVPGLRKIMRVKEGSQIMSLVERFAGIMGATSQKQALEIIAAENKIALTREEAATPLTASRDLIIPIAPKNLIKVLDTSGTESVRDIAERIKDVYYKQGLSVEQIALDIAQMNGIEASSINDKSLLNASDHLMIGLVNNNYMPPAPLAKPAGAADRKVDLLVVEAPNLPLDPSQQDVAATTHPRDTFSIAINSAYAINPQVDRLRFHALEDSLIYYPAGQTPAGPSNALRILLNSAGAPVRDRLVFSVSEVSGVEGRSVELGKSYMNADNIAFEGTRLMLNALEQSKPAIFVAAGNFRITEGPYIQSRTVIHSPRSTIVGAVGQYDLGSGKGLAIAHYSSYFADICVREPVQNNEAMKGTSFTTPVMAALDRQFLEWYGNRLSFEEIKAAGLMSASRDILDFDNPLAMGNRPAPQGDAIKTHSAVFNSNGGGLPHNTFCGAGLADVAKWKKNLDIMVTLKQPGQDAEGRSFTLPVGSPSVQDLQGKKEYTYKFRVPQDMTLGRLSFLLPQNRDERSEVVVKTPAGFEMQMPHALTDIVSTDAFSFEDVHTGDLIEVRTNYPLATTGGMILRGHAPGNAIAMLRDKLRTDGALPAPLKEMEGNRVVGPSKAVTVLRDEKVTYPGFGRP